MARLAAERDGRNDEVRSLTFGAYLTHHWLPAKRLELRVSTHRSYVQKTQRHILPTLGRRRIRRLSPKDLEGLYDSMLHPTDGTRPLAPKTVYEVHLIIRGALDHAVRRGLVTRNVALAASAPSCEPSPRSNSTPGPPPNSRRSCAPQLDTGCSPPCGSPPTPASAATNCSD